MNLQLRTRLLPRWPSRLLLGAQDLCRGGCTPRWYPASGVLCSLSGVRFGGSESWALNSINTMKTAVSVAGKPLVAAGTAPKTAICPNCGGTVILRRRRLMGGSVTYYWRHRDNRRMDCYERHRPVK